MSSESGNVGSYDSFLQQHPGMESAQAWPAYEELLTLNRQKIATELGITPIELHEMSLPIESTQTA